MASKLNGNTWLFVILPILALLAGFVQHNAREVAATAVKVEVVEERETNHYIALCADLCRIESKLDKLLERGE